MKNVVVLLLFGLMQMSVQAEVFWLSETPPSKKATALKKEPVASVPQSEHAGHLHAQLAASGVAASGVAATAGGKKHTHGGGAEVDADGEVVADNTHSGKKQLWLRRGDDARAAAYVSGMQGSLILLGQGGMLPEVTLADEKDRTTVKLDLPELGFYNAYWVQRAVHEGSLHVQIAKAEVLHGTCCAKDIDEEAVGKPIVNRAAELELVREHYSGEGLFTRIVSGDTINYTVLSRGVPVAGAKVTMISHKGWRNSQLSDAQGRVSFTLIRDYYPPSWLDFKKRFKQSYLMTAELELPELTVEGVTYNAAHYTATLAGNYYPSPYDYRSYAWGLGIALFVIVFGGVAIYLYRRRRIKPYQEVRVDAKA